MHNITQTTMLSPTMCYIHPSLEIPADVQAEAFCGDTMTGCFGLRGQPLVGPSDHPSIFLSLHIRTLC